MGKSVLPTFRFTKSTGQINKLKLPICDQSNITHLTFTCVHGCEIGLWLNVVLYLRDRYTLYAVFTGAQTDIYFVTFISDICTNRHFSFILSISLTMRAKHYIVFTLTFFWSWTFPRLHSSYALILKIDFIVTFVS